MTPKNSSVFSARRSLLVAGAATLAAPLVLRAQSPAKVIRIGSPDLGTAGKPSPGGSVFAVLQANKWLDCLLYTSPSPRDRQKSRMPSSA